MCAGLDAVVCLLTSSDSVAGKMFECGKDGFGVVEESGTEMLGLDGGTETTGDDSVESAEDVTGTGVGLDGCWDGRASYLGLRTKSSDVSSSRIRPKELLSTAESLLKASVTFSGCKWVVSLTLSATTEIWVVKCSKTLSFAFSCEYAERKTDADKGSAK